MLGRAGQMVTGLRVEVRLNWDENFSPWRERIVLVLEEFELWDIVEKAMTLYTDPVQLADFNKRNVKAKRLHLIPHVSGKNYDFEMWESLIKLYQSTNENKK